jgi:hypothetical protein
MFVAIGYANTAPGANDLYIETVRPTQLRSDESCA